MVIRNEGGNHSSRHGAVLLCSFFPFKMNKKIKTRLTVMAKITMYLDSKGETVDCFVDYDPDKIFLREYVDTKNV